MNAMYANLPPPMIPPPAHIIVMEDETSVAQGIRMILKEKGYNVELAFTGNAALDTFNREGCDLLIADLRLPDIDGMDVIRQVKAKRPETEAIVITGYANVSSAVEAMKIGVHDYLPKPFTDDQLVNTVEDALKDHPESSATIPLVDFDSPKGMLIQKREVIRVLNRSAEDEAFWRDLMENGTSALDGYHLSWQARAAITSGDLTWINEHVGELTQKQLMFIYSRLEREVW